MILVLRKALQGDRFERLSNVDAGCPQRFGGLLNVLARNLNSTVAYKRRAASEHLVENDRQRIDIASRPDLLALRLFG